MLFRLTQEHPTDHDDTRAYVAIQKLPVDRDDARAYVAIQTLPVDPDDGRACIDIWELPVDPDDVGQTKSLQQCKGVHCYPGTPCRS